MLTLVITEDSMALSGIAQYYAHEVGAFLP